MNIAQAINFIQTRGDWVLQARLAAITSAAPALDLVLNALTAGQNPDGGWPLNGTAGRPTSLYDTCRFLSWLNELDEGGSEMAERARALLVARQSPRGWWRESQDLLPFNPPLWMDAESDEALVYTTALCAATLASYDENPLEVDQAVNWLQGQIAPTGLLPGFRIEATAWAIPAFVANGHRETRSVKRMLMGLGKVLSPEWDAPTLATMLTGLSQAGFPRATREVERGLALLGDLQRPDGGWNDGDGKPDAQLTLQIIRAARRFGLR